MKGKIVSAETTALIPVYNEEDFLRPALESVAPQVDRLVIGDNASTDGTETICRDFQRRFPNIDYYRHPANIGHSANMAFCAEKVETEFVLHVGGHDLLPQGFVSTLKEALQKSPEVVGVFADVHDLELDGSEGRKEFYGNRYDSTGRMKFADRLQDPSPLRRASGFFLGARQGPPFYMIYALFRSESAVPHFKRFQSIFACDWLFVFEMLLEGKMLHVPETHYIRRNNHPADQPEEYMIRISAREEKSELSNRECFHPMIENVLRLSIDQPDETMSEAERWRLYWELERYFRRHYRFTKKVAETLHRPPRKELFRHRILTLIRDLRDAQYRYRTGILRKLFGKRD